MRGNEDPMQKSNFEVEILINGKPVKEYFQEGKSYIEGREGTEFSLRLRNNSWSRKLFIPSIDGMSVMNGEEASFDSSGYIVRANSSITIDGWRISDSEVAKFFFSDPKHSYRKRSGKSKDNLGVIGCVVFDEKARPFFTYVPNCYCVHYPCQCGNSGTIKLSNKDNGFYSTSGANIASLSATNTSANVSNAFSMRSVSQDLGTGFGEAKRSEVTTVEFERASHPEAIFEIFYNTREQLQRMGIQLKEAVYVTPQAFPGQYCKPPQD